jgi:TolB-like protein/tetratricopeptide (TPR) repeat protein/predicted Ser/Thr protein kinase
MESDRADTEIRVGLSIGHYTITGQLGVGGMGEVWLADDTVLCRPVALKFLTARGNASPECRERLQREAQAAAALNHPNIVTIYEVGEYGGRTFMAMEYVAGESLKDRVKRGAVSEDEVLGLGEQIARGLNCAHQGGTIHRDIKPQNILVTPDGTVRILDFGLARSCAAGEITKTSGTVGTVAYMSPEQARGQEIDARSDLFSLGIVLYELATGVVPFGGDYEAAILYAIVNEEAKPVREIRPDISAELERLILELLRKDRDRRLQSAGELAARLHDLRQVSPVEHPKALNRRKLVWGGVAVVVVTILAGLWLVLGSSGRRTGAHQLFLAVLPFENLGQPEDEYFADGVTDAVTMQLAKSKRLGVISRASAMQYRGTARRVQEIGVELGVDYAVTGTVNWDKGNAPGRLRISAALIRVADDTYLWADSYERPLGHVFDLQAEIAGRVAAALHAAVPGAASESGQGWGTNLEAYDFYLRGNQYFNRSWDREDIEFALQMYQRAAELDTNFASAYAMLCRAEESMYWEYFDRSATRKERARRAVDRALTLDPESVEGHLALGYYFYHCELQYDSALAEFKRGLALQPDHVELLNAVGAVERRQGRLDIAVASFQKALQYDPRSYLKAFDVALTYAMMRRFGEANRYLERTTALAPDWPLPYVVGAWLAVLRNGDTGAARKILAQAPPQVDLARSNYYWWLMRVVEPDLHKVLAETRLGSDTAGFYLHRAQVYRLLGDHACESAYADSARQILEPKVQAMPGDARFNSQLGVAYAGLRRKAEAVSYVVKGVELLPTSRDAFDALFLLVNLAETMVIFGEYDAAATQLTQLMQLPGFVSAPYLRLDPLWNQLHENPAFEKLVAGKT